ncbi:hypothetical protein NLG97_g10551 [Lecanicillium saksenae]|uniref:Uncharacterized protein n=1 Tax=Lecanicillium saksenae TaxID=468837 RepID=A0ACC1QEP4_9HYPO|nr:hypothetical protein NLG97_g10551 [Lecanicillium saksenae]
MWRRVQIPSIDDMHRKLSSVQLKPTSEDPRKMAAAGRQQAQGAEEAREQARRQADQHSHEPSSTGLQQSAPLTGAWFMMNMAEKANRNVIVWVSLNPEEPPDHGEILLNCAIEYGIAHLKHPGGYSHDGSAESLGRWIKVLLHYPYSPAEYCTILKTCTPRGSSSMIQQVSSHERHRERRSTLNAPAPYVWLVVPLSHPKT